MIKKTLKINGVERILILDKDETLAQVLRNHLLLTGCKIGCGEGHCGACNVIMNGKVTRSCIYKMSRVPDNAEITTIEGVGTISDMHPIQVAWMAYGCAQCGFCSPGFIISAKVLLDNNPSPTREEVREWFNKQRNLCRCTGYKPLIDATMAAAKVMRGEMTKEDLVFKQTGDSIVGTNYIRPSAAQKVTGTWDFGADDALKMPEGTLRLALTQAKVSHANILSIDTTEAEGMPGVFRVITAKDIKAAGGTNKINGLVMLPKHNKTDGFERPVLCDEKIFQFGDAIAIVAADTEEHARAAADAVKVEIEELPAYMNAMDADVWGWYVKIESVQLSEDGRTAVLTTEPLYQGRYNVTLNKVTSRMTPANVSARQQSCSFMIARWPRDRAFYMGRFSMPLTIAVVLLGALALNWLVLRRRERVSEQTAEAEHLLAGADSLDGTGALPKRWVTLFWAARGSIAESRWAGIVESSLILGSDAAQCDLCLPDSRIRPQHAVLAVRGEALLVQPLGPDTTVFVNGEKIAGEHCLQNNDTLRLGRTTIRLVL